MAVDVGRSRAALMAGGRREGGKEEEGEEERGEQGGEGRRKGSGVRRGGGRGRNGRRERQGAGDKHMHNNSIHDYTLHKLPPPLLQSLLVWRHKCGYSRHWSRGRGSWLERREGTREGGGEVKREEGREGDKRGRQRWDGRREGRKIGGEREVEEGTRVHVCVHT